MLTRSLPALAPELEAVVTRTIGCAIRVHQALGPGFHEAIYQDALSVELECEGLPFEKEFKVAMSYRGPC
jgi:GxxExxY protein